MPLKRGINHERNSFFGVPVIELPAHTSFSSLSSYSKCGKAWQLERLIRVPQAQGWARLGGSAVHTATERFDLGKQDGPQILFDDAFIEEIWDAYLKDPDIDNWTASKKGTEGQAFWWKNGPTYVQRWMDWTKQYSHWRLATLSDGRSGIELEFKPIIGGHEVHMFIDRLYVAPTGDVVVVDIKTGAANWVQNLQLALYAEGVFQATGIRPRFGAFWFARSGQLGTPVELAQWTPEALGEIVSRFFTNIEMGRFPAQQSPLCKSCSVRVGCAAVGGEQASKWDPDYKTTGVEAA